MTTGICLGSSLRGTAGDLERLRSFFGAGGRPVSLFLRLFAEKKIF